MATKRRNSENLAGDLRTAPAYSLAEAARYLRLPLPTLRHWSFGLGQVKPVFRLDDPDRRVSFVHERRGGSHPRGHPTQAWCGAPAGRRALDYVQKKCDVDRPLIDQSFQTDGRFLFIDRLEQLINASKGGQLAMPDLLPQLDRIDRDPEGLPQKLYPFTRATDSSAGVLTPKLVVMNPLVSFGRPSVGGVSTYTIWSRFCAGDSHAHLAADYGIALEAIEEAIRCEAA